MPVDPQIAGLLELLAAADAPMSRMSPAEARTSFLALTVGMRPEAALPMQEVVDVVVPGAEGDLPARIYRPDLRGPLPTVVMFHGGGWVIGDMDTHDGMARAIALGSRAVVLSVGYRLAPESPFPAAVQDALAATRWAAGNLAGLGGNDALGVAGDSAGGNLAAVVAQQLGARVAAQLLVYPATDVGRDSRRRYPSRVENGTGYLLDTETMEWFQRHYAGHLLADEPLLSPILTADLAGVAPAVVVTAELDPLRDEGEAYAEKLRAAGVRVLARRYDGMVHGFFDMGPLSAAAAAAVDETCALFAEVLHP